MLFLGKKKMLSLAEMNEIETWVQNECVATLGPCSLGGEAIAQQLKLKVERVPRNQLPKHVEARLCPVSKQDDSAYMGVIQINEEKTSSFAYIHEIMHYIRDVGIGMPVTVTYTRKEKGHTDDPHEQIINYAAAAYCLPKDEIKTYIEEYDCQGIKANAINFVRMIADKYQQSDDTVLRRINEVRRLFSV